MSWVFRREARVLSRFESRVSAKAGETLVVNARERDALRRLAPGATVTVLENGVDLEYFGAAAARRASKNVVFCGVMDYAPNVEGVLWFVRDVWPAVRAAHEDARFVIVGSNPSRSILALRQEPGIAVTGAVSDVRPYLWEATVSVAPLLAARGVQNKVLEALASGLPVVITPAVAAGLPASVLPGCIAATDAAGFAAAVAECLDFPPDRRLAVAAAADLGPLSWNARAAPLAQILARVAHR
jgi:glycosyltransferase involved in cell wall biosynthesis